MWDIVTEMAKECAAYVPQQYIDRVELSAYKYENKISVQWMYRHNMLSRMANKMK